MCEGFDLSLYLPLSLSVTHTHTHTNIKTCTHRKKKQTQNNLNEKKTQQEQMLHCNHKYHNFQQMALLYKLSVLMSFRWEHLAVRAPATHTHTHRHTLVHQHRELSNYIKSCSLRGE